MTNTIDRDRERDRRIAAQLIQIMNESPQFEHIIREEYEYRLGIQDKEKWDEIDQVWDCLIQPRVRTFLLHLSAHVESLVPYDFDQSIKDWDSLAKEVDPDAVRDCG